MTVHKLSAPIEAHGETLSELNIRRPTPDEARGIRSLPYRIGKDEEITVDLDVAAKYIAVCAGLPPSAVNQLDLSDLNSLTWMVVGFFLTPASATLTA